MGATETDRRTIVRVLFGDGPTWVSYWGRGVLIHIVAIRAWIDECGRRPSVTWQEIEEGVERILSSRPHATRDGFHAKTQRRNNPEPSNVPREFLAEPRAESVPTPQRVDAGGIACRSDPAPSVEAVIESDVVCVRPLGVGENLFEVLLGVRGVILTRGAVEELARQASACAAWTEAP